MKSIVTLFFGMVFSAFVLAAGSAADRLPATPNGKEKKAPASKPTTTTCAQNMADSGYTLLVVNTKSKINAHLSESTIAGSRHVADLVCQHTRSSSPPAPDMMFQVLECSGDGYRVEYFSGGFAGLNMVDIFKGEKQVADNIICRL